MAGERILGSGYRVERGDSLWAIARARYGNPQMWRTIAEDNSLRYPYVIFVGQRLSLPGRPYYRNGIYSSFQPHEANTTARSVANPAFTVDLDGKEMRFTYPGFELTIKLQGSVTMRARGRLDDFEVSISAVSFKYKPEAQTVLGKAISEATIKYGPDNCLELSISGGALTFVANSQTNSLKWICKGQPIKKECGAFEYEGVCGFEAELKRSQNDVLTRDRAIVMQLATESVTIGLRLQKVLGADATRLADRAQIPYGLALIIAAGMAAVVTL